MLRQPRESDVDHERRDRHAGEDQEPEHDENISVAVTSSNGGAMKAHK